MVATRYGSSGPASASKALALMAPFLLLSALATGNAVVQVVAAVLGVFWLTMCIWWGRVAHHRHREWAARLSEWNAAFARLLKSLQEVLELSWRPGGEPSAMPVKKDADRRLAALAEARAATGDALACCRHVETTALLTRIAALLDEVAAADASQPIPALGALSALREELIEVPLDVTGVAVTPASARATTH